MEENTTTLEITSGLYDETTPTSCGTTSITDAERDELYTLRKK